MLANLLSVLCGCALAWILYRWRSPLLMIAPSVVVTAVTLPFTEYDALWLGFIYAIWIVTFLISAYYMRSRRISLFYYSEISENDRNFSRRGLMFLAGAIALLFGIAVIWLIQANITEFDSAKRTRTAGDLYNIARSGINLYAIHAVVTLSLMRLRLGNPHIILALGTFLILLILGYLSSSRGMFVVPLLMVLIFRLAKSRSPRGRVKIVTIAVLFGTAVTLPMAIISAERARVNNLAAGYVILTEQLTSAEYGYGFSPTKDLIAMEFSENHEIRELRTVLLGGFYGLVPRVLWPEKPEFVNSGPIAGAILFRRLYAVDGGAGIPVSFPAELALAFGHRWFFFGVFSVLLLTLLIAEISRRVPILVFPSLTFYAGLISHGLPKTQVDFLVDCALILVLVYVARFRVVYKRSERSVSS